MKNLKRASAAETAAARKALFRAILSLRTPAECEQFFTDLCTPAELEALVDRWAVVGFLDAGLPSTCMAASFIRLTRSDSLDSGAEVFT